MEKEAKTQVHTAKNDEFGFSAKIFVPLQTSDIQFFTATQTGQNAKTIIIEDANVDETKAPKIARISGSFAKVGVNLNNLRWEHAHLMAAHESMRDKPIQYTFNPMPFIPEHNNYSANTAGWVIDTHVRENGAFYTADITHPEVVAKLSRKTSTGRPEIAGVSMSCTADAICSVCGDNMVTGECIHIPGQYYDGNHCEIIATNAVFQHLLLTNFPADDTPLDAVSISATLNRKPQAKALSADVEVEETKGDITMSEDKTKTDVVEPEKVETTTEAAPVVDEATKAEVKDLKAKVDSLIAEKSKLDATEVKGLIAKAVELEASVKGLADEDKSKLEASLAEASKEMLEARIDALSGLTTESATQTATSKTADAADVTVTKTVEGDKTTMLKASLARIDKLGTTGALAEAAKESGMLEAAKENPNSRSIPLGEILGGK